jgi:hypothetical protein
MRDDEDHYREVTRDVRLAARPRPDGLDDVAHVSGHKTNRELISEYIRMTSLQHSQLLKARIFMAQRAPGLFDEFEAFLKEPLPPGWTD